MAAGLVAALLVCLNAGAATPTTRAVYVQRLEQSCQPDAEATERAMRGARKDIQTEKLGVAAGKFSKAASIFSATLRKITPVPRPAADTAKLGKWFSYLRRQQDYLTQITAQLRAKRAIKVQRLTSRFIHNGNLANYVVLPFGFDYCSFKFSRYG